MQKERRMDRSKGPRSTRALSVVLVGPDLQRTTVEQPCQDVFSAGGCGQPVEKARDSKEWVWS